MDEGEITRREEEEVDEGDIKERREKEKERESVVNEDELDRGVKSGRVN